MTFLVHHPASGMALTVLYPTRSDAEAKVASTDLLHGFTVTCDVTGLDPVIGFLLDLADSFTLLTRQVADDWNRVSVDRGETMVDGCTPTFILESMTECAGWNWPCSNDPEDPGFLPAHMAGFRGSIRPELRDRPRFCGHWTY